MTGIAVQLGSERVAAAGGFQGGGVLRLLGTPHMDRLTLLVREAVQNSWDAKCPEGSTIDFWMNLYSPDEHQRGALRTFFDQSPSKSTGVKRLLRAKDLLLLEVGDTGTTGLDGPTRADEPSDGPRNFVNFVRNIGATKTHGETGGTYGFGKGSYYMASQAACIVIYTRCRVGKRVESRLIGAAVGEPFKGRGSAPHTGRHFWGVSAADGDLIEPVTGSDADNLARAIGFTPLPGVCGTSILVVGLDPGTTGDESIEGQSERPRTPPEVAGHLTSQIVWNCWPKMVARGGTVPVEFSVRLEGEAVEVPHITSIPSLRAFARCFESLLAGGEEVHAIRSQRPDKLLGHLALRQYSAADPAEGFGSEPGDFDVPTHHVALLRSPELVVKYLREQPLGLDDHGWAGVFLAASDVDDSFAAAEPPTHDDWVKESIQGRDQKKDVNIALREIRACVRERFAQIESDGPRTGTSAVGLAAALGGVFMTAGNSGRYPQPESPRKPGTPKSHTPRVPVVAAELGYFGGRPAHLLSLDVARIPWDRALRAGVGVAVDSGAAVEREAPMGAVVPLVLGWVIDGIEVDEVDVLTWDRVVGVSKLIVAVECVPHVVPVLTVQAVND